MPYRLDGKQTSLALGDFAEASRFRDMANQFGVKNALAAVQAEAKVHGSIEFTVTGWSSQHVDHLITGAKCRAHIAYDVDVAFGSIPLPALSREHVVQRIQRMPTAQQHSGRLTRRHGPRFSKR